MQPKSVCHPTRLVIMAVFYASSGGPNYAERDLPTTDFLGRETGTHAESRMEKGDVEWRGERGRLLESTHTAF